MGGVSKYLLNGHRSTQQDIQKIFMSVQLNINNPNFLIMQGKITKVLNMKPKEILGMIEEAAGTSMFEDRKDKAEKAMAKKEKKVDEIQSLLKEEIQPKLERLRQERRIFQEWQQAQSQVEKLNRLVAAHDWVMLQHEWAKRFHRGTSYVDTASQERALCQRMQSEARSSQKWQGSHEAAQVRDAED